MASGSTRTYVVPRLQPTGFWRFDSKAIVAGAFLGILLVLVQQVTHRADNALTGGAFLIFGGISWAAIMGISTLLCRQPAGVITGVLQGIVALASALTPLAPIFPIVNAAGSLAYSLVAWKLPMDRWLHHVLAQVAASVVGNALVSIGLLTILKLPVTVILVSSGVTTLACIVGGTLLTKLVADAVAKSGVMD